MTKEKNNKNRNLIILATAIILIVGVFAFVNFNKSNYKPETSNSAQQTKTFQSSDTLDFSIVVPAEYEVNENLGSATINANGVGEISIGRNGTNNSNIDEYLNDLVSRNNVVYSEKEDLIIDNKEAVNLIIQHPASNNPDSFTYFIYVDNFVYRFSTIEPRLYDDLDQIAQSFKYTGE